VTFFVCLIVTFQEGLGVSSAELSDSVIRIGVKLVGNMAHTAAVCLDVTVYYSQACLTSHITTCTVYSY
jgi:hypothetical protein